MLLFLLLLPFPRQGSVEKRRGNPSDVGNGDLDLDTWLDGDGGDLLHHIGRRVQVNQALVNAHLEAVEGVRTFAAGRLAHAEPEGLRGQARWSSHLQLLLPSAAD